MRLLTRPSSLLPALPLPPPRLCHYCISFHLLFIDHPRTSSLYRCLPPLSSMYVSTQSSRTRTHSSTPIRIHASTHPSYSMSLYPRPNPPIINIQLAELYASQERVAHCDSICAKPSLTRRLVRSSISPLPRPRLDLDVGLRGLGAASACYGIPFSRWMGASIRKRGCAKVEG
ncbi:hypothetical protein BDN70DRAFT_271163 [Pholiota conissans]|uniref:Uncharacterized protein n=1 Tax=Pholiota conissans TaxID=109636 RepID=A0A9P5YU35_9AGAR|nr:hypothetical protein BDN70DRAFT_271163 [Pholiota conissans]